jgi:signal transduction histidine kinase
LSTLNRIVTLEKPSAVLKGFIITEDDRYLGVGTGLALLQATNDEAIARSVDLERARHQLERANRAKSEFLANMSHELRTPLNAIIGFSELMAKQTLGPIGNELYVDYLRDIYNSGEHLLGIINDVLDMARFEAGRLQLHESEVDLCDVVERSVRMVNGRAEEQDISISAELPDSLPWLLGDTVKLQQVIVNLLSNAVKFTPPNGRICVSGDWSDDGIIIAVRDTGVGIPRDKLDEVLEPFKQVDSGLARRHDGAGLGLPLSKSLIELHGGTFTIDSDLGKGTTVTIELPAARLLERGNSWPTPPEPAATASSAA